MVCFLGKNYNQIVMRGIMMLMDNFSEFNDLPTREFASEIVNAIDENQVTILTAETGAGKSTQVPQYLAEHGYSRIIVTQPRILAARNLTLRVREEWAERNTEDSSEIIGYRTAHERDDSGKSKILYCTDGLQLVRELTGIGTNPGQILVLDEVHEWNENMEVLVAWAKKRVLEDPKFKVLVMSATFDVESLAEYFGGAAIFRIPGRHFEVKKRTGEDILSELFIQLETPGRNILTFLPGKSEIQDVSDAIIKKADKAGVPVIPLHSQLEMEEQQKAFGKYKNGKIILSTNIAQTSVTIDDIDMVIDSGLERRSEVRNGVEGLFISQTSQADCLQRAGRAGRTKPGEYILAAYDTMPCLPFEERPEYPTPEILRKHIDRLTLRLANIGIDIETLDFYHDPSKAAIKRAKRTLVALGALTKTSEITGIGREMERFPVQSNYARMLVEVGKYSAEVKAKLATIIAIAEIDGIVKSGTLYTGWRRFTSQTKSDLLAQYDVLLAIESGQIDEEKYEDLGIIYKNVLKARETEERLLRDLNVEKSGQKITKTEEESLMKSIVAGQIDQLWTLGDRRLYENIYNGDKREISSGSVVKSYNLIAATAFDLQIPAPSGELEVLHLIQGATAVKTDWLFELAPHMFKLGQTKIFYDPRMNCLAQKRQLTFNKRSLQGSSEPILEDTEQNRYLFRKEFVKWAHTQVIKQRQNLEKYYGRRIPPINQNLIEKEVRDVAPDIISLDQLDSDRKKYMISLSKIETYFDDNFWDKLGANNFSSRKRKFGRNNHRKSWVEHKKHSKKQKKFKRNKKF